jgi:hypothetical protein
MNTANKIISDETSEISHQKPNSLASKNNTAMRLNLIVDDTVNIGENEDEDQILFHNYVKNIESQQQQQQQGINLTTTANDD